MILLYDITAARSPVKAGNVIDRNYSKLTHSTTLEFHLISPFHKNYPVCNREVSYHSMKPPDLIRTNKDPKIQSNNKRNRAKSLIYFEGFKWSRLYHTPFTENGNIPNCTGKQRTERQNKHNSIEYR